MADRLGTRCFHVGAYSLLCGSEFMSITVKPMLFEIK